MDHVLRTANIQRLGRGRPPSKGDSKGGAKEVGEKLRNYGVIATKTGGRVSKRKEQATVSKEIGYIRTEHCLLDLATRKATGPLDMNSFRGEEEIDVRVRRLKEVN